MFCPYLNADAFVLRQRTIKSNLLVEGEWERDEEGDRSGVLVRPGEVHCFEG